MQVIFSNLICSLTQQEKQMIVLAGSGMMLVEVLLVGQIVSYSLILLSGYILIFRLFNFQVLKVQHFIVSQLGSLAVFLLFNM